MIKNMLSIMNRSTCLMAIMSISLCCFAPLLYAAVKPIQLSDLMPSPKHVGTVELIKRILNTHHYKKTVLDDTLSESIFKIYIENLDQNRSYFTQSDIQSFAHYRHQLDDSIKQSKLEPAYAIFKHYRRCVESRIDYAIPLLDGDFDFSIDEEYRFDRTEDDWAINNQTLDQIWYKRIKNDFLNLRLSGKEDQEIKETLRKRYQRIKTNVQQININDVFQFFMNAYATAIEPHTAYFSPHASENFDISMSLSLEGIGAVLRSEHDYTEVVEIIVGGPADLSNELSAGDKIIGVKQADSDVMEDVIGWRLDDVVDLIRGPKDTVVQLEVLPKDSSSNSYSKVVAITRDKIKLEDQDASADIITIPNTDAKIGVIDLPTFYVDFAAQRNQDDEYKSTSRDVAKLLKEMHKEDIEGLIIDLRGNGGGSLSEVIALTGLFVANGPVVQTKNATGKIDISYAQNDIIRYDGPLAVLVDRYSASASEIFAGAIQDYQRGIIIGEPTFGKGTVQTVINLNRFINEDGDHGRLKATVAQFFRISGDSNQYKGVVPNIIFPMALESNSQSERSYDNALPWTKIKATRYPLYDDLNQDGIDYAQTKYEQRVKHNKLFQLLLENIEFRNQKSARKTVYLLESKRKLERDEILAKERNIENEMRIAQGLEPLEPIVEDEVLSEEKEKQQDDESDYDLFLNETAHILYDIITHNAKTDNQVVDLESLF